MSGFAVSRSGLAWRPLIAVIACVSVFDVTLGLTYPLLAVLLEARGIDATMIGLNAAMTPVGLVLFAPFVPPLARYFGARRLALACMVTTGVVLILFKAVESLAAWFVLRFVLGVAEAGLFAISETWINEMARGGQRGRVVALYSSLLSAGFAAGPFLLAVVGPEGWPPFIAGLAFVVAGVIPLVVLRDGLPAPSAGPRVSMLRFLPRAPVLLVAVIVFAIFDTATMSLFPLYGLREGLSESVAATALGVLIAGNILLQYPLGWLADHVPRRRVLVGCAVLTAVGGITLPLVIQSWWLWPFLFVWGSTAFGLYTLAMAELGDRFTGNVLLAGAAAFTAAWGIGGIAGPPLGGLAMETFGPSGLPYTLAACATVVAVAAAARWTRHHPAAPRR